MLTVDLGKMMTNLSAVIIEARQQFLAAGIGSVYAEGVAVETREGIIFGGKSSENYGFIGVDEALRPLTSNLGATLRDELKREFEIATIAIAVAKGGKPNKATLDKLATYIGTQDGQVYTVVYIDNSEQICETQELKL